MQFSASGCSLGQSLRASFQAQAWLLLVGPLPERRPCAALPLQHDLDDCECDFRGCSNVEDVVSLFFQRVANHLLKGAKDVWAGPMVPLSLTVTFKETR